MKKKWKKNIWKGKQWKNWSECSLKKQQQANKEWTYVEWVNSVDID